MIRFIQDDALAALASLPEASVHCVVTSPPYWGLRSYGGDLGMIGLEPTFEEHMEKLVAVFREVRRVLRPDGTVFLNYGDAYANSCSGGNGLTGGLEKSTLTGRMPPPGTTPVKKSIPPGLKPKDLMMMPARVALALQADGWWLRSEIIWHKPNPMPESVTDRPTSAHEKIYLLTKSAKYFYDAAAVRVPNTGKTIARAQYAKTDNGKREPNRADSGLRAYEERTNGKTRGHARPHQGFNETWDGMTKAEQQASGANLRNVWTIATHPYRGAHFATFPPKLVEPCIKAGTSEKGCCATCGSPWGREVEIDYSKRRPHAVTGRVDGGDCRMNGQPQLNKHVTTIGWSPTCACEADVKPCTVIDPFGGSGTVGLVADQLGRDAILVELNPEYVEMARERLRQTQPLFYQEAEEE